ncbi:hypothetical protein F5Y16DRAFT_395825 [Xylariaceae sp. FL0255]|nr:hypothetical protein F5Y16DRAFT_395825 [Xylariaceae sp. FL0255]
MPLGRTVHDSLQNEIEILQTINGSMHTVGLIAYRDDTEDRAEELARLPFPRVDPEQGDFLAGLARVPILKLIDFGETDNDDTAQAAMSDNLYYISEAILCLIIRTRDLFPLGSRAGTWKGIETDAKELSDAWQLDNPVDPYAHVDTELRDLVCRCMAKNHNDRYTLAQAFDKATQAVVNTTATSLSLHGTVETDDDVQQFVQDMILNAN